MPDEDPIGLVTLAQAKGHLNISSSTGSDTELEYFIGVASDLVQNATNHIWIETEYTDERHKGGTDAIVLHHSPVSAVASVVDSGRTVSPSDYTLTASTGLVRLVRGVFTPGPASVAVSYTAGTSEVPALATHAVLETLRHLWTTQRGTVVRTQMSGDDYGSSATTYTLPMRVIELIDRLSLSTGIG